jgi:putative ABC transport system permease protein
MPAVDAAAAVRFLPLGGVASMRTVSRLAGRGEDLPAAFHHVVTPGYFETVQIPLVSGRVFSDTDDAGGSRPAILSATAARRYFPDQSPLGRMLHIDDDAKADWEVVGVVGDVRNVRLDRLPRPQVYVPAAQSPAVAMTIVARTSRDPLALAGPLRDAVRRIDPAQSVADIRLMADVVGDASAPWRVSTTLFLAFGATSVVLALAGLYGVTAYAVAERTRELAVRMALGGTRASVVTLVVRSLAPIAAGGAVAGALFAAALARAIASLLYATQPFDPATVGAAALGFAAVVMLTGVAAASRAAAIDPIVALRHE